MTAKSAWWFCGACGFRNHPRLKVHDGIDPALCEQCGAARDHPEAKDYVPADTGRVGA